MDVTDANEAVNAANDDMARAVAELVEAEADLDGHADRERAYDAALRRAGDAEQRLADAYAQLDRVRT